MSVYFCKIFYGAHLNKFAITKQLTRSNILNEREHILSTVEQYVDNSLYHRKHNILNPLKEYFEKTPIIKNFLAELGLTEDQYYNALSISSDSESQIHIKGSTNACSVNNFFTEGLQSWKTNIDIQPVFNHGIAVTYMCTI